ncbi:MAG TPA: FAD-dependent oxidoreductase [Candidatus Limnocylindrales bacterium]|nr:FAD-dependent oxidoreductase [Candidatus Limnocylindrales bacterium]
MNPNASKPKVVVLGGGFGGLETAYALRSSLPERTDITLVSDRSYFLFKPNMIYIPFGLEEDKLHVDIARPAQRRGIRFLEASVRDLDPVRKSFSYERDGEAHTDLYDYLVVATGAAMRPEEIPGLREYARPIGTPADMLKLRPVLGRLLERAKYGQMQKLLLSLPAHSLYGSALYEMAFMIDRWLREANVRDRVTITFTTAEKSYLDAFGPQVHEMTRTQFDERGIVHHRGRTLHNVEQGAAHFAKTEVIPFDMMLTMPPYVASVPFAALPSDERGFVDAHLASRRMKGLNDLFGVGDSCDFPVKQAFLALQQADAAAEGIAADIEGRQPRFMFEPVSKFVLEGWDSGMFAQTPFSLEGGLHVDVANPQYRTGHSPLWRMGKKMLGTMVPWRFSQGEPFNAGLSSTGLELGVKIMTGVMAGHKHAEPVP